MVYQYCWFQRSIIGSEIAVPYTSYISWVLYFAETGKRWFYGIFTVFIFTVFNFPDVLNLIFAVFNFVNGHHLAKYAKLNPPRNIRHIWYIHVCYGGGTLPQLPLQETCCACHSGCVHRSPCSRSCQKMAFHPHVLVCIQVLPPVWQSREEEDGKE